MKHLLVALTLTISGGVVASAGLVTYNTTGSTLSCGSNVGCVQNSSVQVTVGGITLIYNAALATTVEAVPFSIIQYGNITATGAGNTVSLNGILLTLNIFSTPPSGSGNIPGGSLVGTINTNQSGASLTFGPSNTTSVAFGFRPGVVISGGNQAFLYQVNQTSLSIVPPTPGDGNPFGTTTIGGNVSDVSTPEPSTVLMLGLGLGGFGLLRRKRPQA